MYIILDTETTDLNNPRIVEIALAIIHDEGDLNSVEMYSGRYMPPVPITTKAMSVHGITPEDVENKPPFVGSSIYDMLTCINNKENTMIIHNAKFDLEVLKNEGIEVAMNVIDTLKCCRNIFVDNPHVENNLQFLKYHLSLHKETLPPGLADMNLDPHSAAGDVVTLYLMFRRMAAKYQVQTMLEWSSKPFLYKTLSFGKHKGEALSDIVGKDINYVYWLLKNCDDEDLLYSLKYYMKGKKK